jgi:hypothetical protein
MVPFWINDPSILLNKNYIGEIWPISSMYYEQKLNSITRLVLIITLLGYLITFSTKILISGIITIVVIVFLYKMRKQKLTNSMMKEGFDVNGDVVSGLYEETRDIHYKAPITITNPETLETYLKEDFKQGTKKNPFSNVLMTDYLDDPERKAAPPAFNVDVDEDITKKVKKSVQFMNPGIKNTNKQLYSSLTDQFYLDQSNRSFFSTANTKIPNDQGAFANFLYGDMPSGKEDTEEGKIQAVKDNYRYILY